MGSRGCLAGEDRLDCFSHSFYESTPWPQVYGSLPCAHHTPSNTLPNHKKYARSKFIMYISRKVCYPGKEVAGKEVRKEVVWVQTNWDLLNLNEDDGYLAPLWHLNRGEKGDYGQPCMASSHFSCSLNRTRHMPLTPGPSEPVTGYCGCPLVCNIGFYAYRSLVFVEHPHTLTQTLPLPSTNSPASSIYQETWLCLICTKTYLTC